MEIFRVKRWIISALKKRQTLFASHHYRLFHEGYEPSLHQQVQVFNKIAQAREQTLDVLVLHLSSLSNAVP